MVHIGQQIDDTKCYDIVRKLGWSEGVRCPDFVPGCVRTPWHYPRKVALLFRIFFEFIHNVRHRGKTLFYSLLTTFVAP